MRSASPFLVLFLCVLGCTAFLWGAAVGPAAACFGPKLYIGVGGGAEGELAFAFLSLYLKEKTGVESIKVDLAGKDGLAELAAARVDLAVVATAPAAVTQLAPGMVVASGNRPRDDLQFTTVLPALSRLERVMSGADWSELAGRVRRGDGALATARAFFTARGAL